MEEETTRPYRLWDAKNSQYVRWRYYKFPRNAHLGALIEARWAQPGFVCEVVDIRTMALLGQYRRTPTSVVFTKIKKEKNAEEN